jgi:hypothetical protein
MIPDDLDITIKFFHASLPDFLMSRTWSGDEYFVDPIQHHVFILDGCIQIMTNEFKFGAFRVMVLDNRINRLFHIFADAGIIT